MIHHTLPPSILRSPKPTRINLCIRTSHYDIHLLDTQNKENSIKKDKMAAELRQKLIGAWALVEYKTQPASGAPASYPLGKDAAGIIMYTPDGYMSAQLMQPGAAKFVVGDLSGGTKDELAESMKRYLAYSGRFAVKGEGGKPVLTHQMEVSSFPNWLGNVQERTVKLEGEYLTLGTDGPILVQVGNYAFFRPISPDGRETDFPLFV